MDEEIRLTVGGTTSVDKTLLFKYNSIIVNNLSNQWVQVNSGDFVQPYIMRAIIPANGASRIQVKFATPPGASFVATATIAGELATITLDEVAYPPSAGVQAPVRAPSTEWRNPKGINFYASNVFAGAVAFSSDWSYTVPAGRRARIDTAQCITEVTISDGTGGGTIIGCEVDFQALGAGTITNVAEAYIRTGTVQGARADALISAGKELIAGDKVFGVSGNPRGGGVTIWAVESAVITEGDA